MRITAREKNKDGSMIRISLDERYAFSIPADSYTAYGLYEKDELSDGELSDIKQNIIVQAAREKAVHLLNARDRSESELKNRLRIMGFDAEPAQKAVEELKAIGYVNDARYILKYASDRAKNKAISRKALKYELEQKGIEASAIDEALGDFEQNDDEAAFRAAKKKFGKYDLSDPAIEKKLLGFLAHRGFSYEIASSVLQRLKGKED